MDNLIWLKTKYYKRRNKDYAAKSLKSRSCLKESNLF
jgi:hypothetical protein